MISLLLSLFLPLTPLAQATEWNDVLGDLQTRNNGNPTSCAEQNKALCKDPVKELCSLVTPAASAEYEALKKQLRESVAFTPQGDILDEGYKKVLALQKRADDTSKKYSTAINELMNDDIEHPTRAQKAAYDRKNQEVETLDKKITDQSTELFQKQQEQIQKIAKLESVILSHFGKNKTDLENTINGIKKSLIASVKSTAEYSPTQDEIKKKINSISIEFASNRATRQLSSEEKKNSRHYVRPNEEYFADCGSDGMRANASYDPLQNVLRICPGFLVKSLGQTKGDLKSLSVIIGHELGHSFDSNADVGTGAAYQKLLACVKDNFMRNPREKFKPLAEYIARLKIGIPKLKTELLRLQRLPHPDLSLIASYKRSLLAYASDLEEKQEIQTDPKDLVSMERGELEADFQASVILQNQIKTIPEEKRGDYLKNNLKAFCSMPEQIKIRKIVLGDLETDGIHPPNTFRVESFLRNKNIRAALGCAPLTRADRPWCGLNGAEH